MPRILLPNDLDADTIVPQFTDNQYVTEPVFRLMTAKGLDFNSPKIQGLRREYVRNELIRALIYSSQVVINRSAFRNNRLLSELFDADADTHQQFAALMRPSKDLGSAIVPFFLKERDLTDDLDFTTLPAGDAACKALADSLAGDYQALCFSHEQSENSEFVKSLGTGFRGFLVNLSGRDEQDANRLAADLFSGNDSLGHEQFAYFRSELKRLSRYVFEQEKITREQVYEDWFIDHGEAAKGRFKSDDERTGCLFELKKLVDLRYTSMLPDRLNRYTFVPQGMPARTALADETAINRRISEQDFARFLDEQQSDLRELQRIVMSRMHESMVVPAAGSLTLDDVANIRAWDEWHEFTYARRRLIESISSIESLQRQDFFVGFQRLSESFQDFQRCLGKWLVEKSSKPKKRAVKVLGYITCGLRIGPYALSLFSPEAAKNLKDGIEFAEKLLDENQKKTLRGASLNILTNFLNVESGVLEHKLSLNQEVMNGQLEATREWLSDVANKARKASNASLTHLGERANSSLK